MNFILKFYADKISKATRKTLKRYLFLTEIICLQTNLPHDSIHLNLNGIVMKNLLQSN